MTLGASWPLARDFTTRALADIPADYQHSLWMLWHVKEACLGRQPLFTADLLFYPHGLSTLVDGVGPVSGILALPFWPWGPIAAYNGALVVGLTLSGWCMYLLVRYGRSSTGLVPAFTRGAAAPCEADGHGSMRDAQTRTDEGMLRAIAFFAGAAFMLWPLQLAGLWGHLEKVFVGSLPLSVLAAIVAWDPRRSRWLLLAPGSTLLLALLQNGNQFLFAVMALLLLGVWSIVTAPGAVRRALLGRVLATGALAAVTVGPLLYKVAAVAFDPSLHVSVNLAAPYYAPDVLQFVVPSIHQRVLGSLVYPDFLTIAPLFTRVSYVAVLNQRPDWIGSGIETAVTVPIVVLVLGVIAATARYARARIWLLFSGVFMLLALGPVLRIAGRTSFTDFRQMQLLPYAYLASLPGFDSMRTPGRLMMMASVGLLVLAAAGLAVLVSRVRRPALGATVATALVLIECWPVPWPQQVPPPLSRFHRHLADDPERYAILDLPGRGVTEYMYYQTIHGKGIPWGYLSRSPHVNPVTPVLQVEATELAPGAAKELRTELARLGYRYIVWHKHWEMFGNRRPEAPATNKLGIPTGWMANAFLREAFVGERPMWDDELVTVFRTELAVRADGRADD